MACGQPRKALEKQISFGYKGHQKKREGLASKRAKREEKEREACISASALVKKKRKSVDLVLEGFN